MDYESSSRKGKMKIDVKEPAPVPIFHPISIPIALLIGVFILGGLFLSYNGLMAGLLFGILGVLALKYGIVNHPAEPPTIGLVTFFNKPLVLDGKAVVVRGTTLLARWCLLDTIKINMTYQDKNFKMKVFSEDNVQMDMTISATMCPDSDDLIDYITAGQMDNVAKQLEDEMYTEAQKECRIHKWRVLTMKGEDVATKVNATVFRQPKLGVILSRLVVEILPPASIVKDAEQVAKEALQQGGEFAEFNTTLTAAEKRLAAYEKNPKLETATAEMLKERQIRQGQATRVDLNITGDSKTPIGTVIVNVGGNKKKEDK